MIRLLSIFLLCAFLTQNFSRLIILVNHRINLDYIVANLCENRNKPQAHCNGQCHLKKQIAKEEKNEKDPVINLKATEIQLFSQDVVHTAFLRGVTQAVAYAPFDGGKVRSASISVFHPPSV